MDGPVITYSLLADYDKGGVVMDKMNLHEQVAYKLIKIHKLGRVGADFDDKETDELITLIRTATLDEVKEALHTQPDYIANINEKGGYVNLEQSMEAIDNLIGESDE